MNWALLSLLFVALILTFVLMWAARRRATGARVDPPIDRRPIPVEKLRERLFALGREDGPIAVEETEGYVTITWRLVGVPFATTLFRAGLRKTQALELEIREDEKVVLVRYGVGSIEWETTAATWMPKANVQWSWPMMADFGRLGADAGACEPPSNDTPRSLENLVAPVRQCVLDAGYAWQPVLYLRKRPLPQKARA